MINQIISISYSKKLLDSFLETSKKAVIISNFIAPLIAVIALYGVIPNLNLMIWLSLHLSILPLRLYLANKVEQNLFTVISLKAFSKEKSKASRYFNLYLLTVFATSMLYGALSIGLTIYDAPDFKFLIIAILLLTLSAGTVASLAFVFIAFLGFVSLSLIPFAIAMLYHGSLDYYLISLIITIFTIVFIRIGYLQFCIFREAVKLEERYTTIFNKSSDGIVIIQNARLTEPNETVYKMFGYEEEKELFSTNHISSFSPKLQFDGQCSKRKMLAMLSQAKTQTKTFEWQHIRKNGEVFWVEITLRPMLIDGEAIIHGIWRDIDSRKEAERALKELNDSLELRVAEGLEKSKIQEMKLREQARLAQMGEMISMIAHQWRQPLNAISLTSSNLHLKCVLDDIDSEYFQDELALIDNYSQHLSSTIDDFRSFFKVDKVTQNIKINDIIQESLKIIQISLENKNITLELELNSTKPIKTFPNEVMQVVLNIIKNAEDALVEKAIKNPKIKIVTDDYTISISDNAGGISEEIITKIFDPYFSTKLQKDGTGLGLYMSKTIIEEHCGGTIDVKNNTEGASFLLNFYKSRKSEERRTIKERRQTKDKR